MIKYMNSPTEIDIERTLVLLKPDAVQRGLVGRIIQRFEDVGLKIVATKMIWPTKELAENIMQIWEKEEGRM